MFVRSQFSFAPFRFGNVGRTLAAGVLLTLLVSTAAHAAEAGSLLKWVPADSNGLVIVDAKTLFASPLAQREGWRDRFTDRYSDSPLLLPPEAEQVVMAVELDFGVMVPQWETAAMRVDRDWSVDELATALHGTVDSIGGLPAVRTPSNTYVLKCAPRQYGLYAPANRQAVSRWVRQSQAAGPASLPPYLARIAEAPAGSAALRMAIDLQDVFPRSEIGKVLRSSQALRTSGVDLDTAVDILAQLEGLTLTVSVTDSIQGTLDVHFAGEIAPLQKVAKQLVCEQFRNLGAQVEELEEWDASVADRAIQLSGTLSETALRRLLSLFAMGHSRAMPVHVDKPPVSVTQEEPGNRRGNLDYSRKYFQSVASYVNELQLASQTASPYQFMMWLDSYADRIDQLPWAGVDAELQAYAKRVSVQFRQMLAALNGLNQQSIAQQSQIVPNRVVTTGMMPTWRTYNYGGYRTRQYAPFAYQSVDVGGAQQQQQQIQRDALQKAEGLARNILEKIGEETEAIRTKMTQRYQQEF